MPFALWVGLRYFLTRKRYAFISVISVLSIAGVLIGVTALIVVLAVMTGFGNELRRRILGANADIVVRQFGGIEDEEGTLNRIRSIEGVRAVGPLVDGQVLLRTETEIRGVMLRGVDERMEPKVTCLGDWMKKGSLTFSTPDFPVSSSSDSADRGILLGKDLAQMTDVAVGDLVTLVASENRPEFGGLEPKMRVYQITGLYQSGIGEFDTNVVYISHRSATDLLNLEGRWPAVHVKVAEEGLTDRVASKIADALGVAFSVQSWKEINRSFFFALELEKKAMAVILTLIVLVASSNIACTLIMVVIEKTKDIGLLKAIGAKSRTIVMIFVAQGLYVGLIGTAMGCGAGYAICRLLQKYHFITLPSDVYYMDTLPVEMRPWDFAWISCAALAISLLATIYPAVRAARMDPVEALRDE